MIKTNCNSCNTQEIPINDTINIDGRIYCHDCFENQYSEKDALKDKSVKKQFDSTICSFCNKDFLDLELNKLGSYPICKDCEITVKNKTFPSWVKLFFISIVFIIIGSFLWNWKYYTAYNQILESNRSVEKGDYKKGSLLMNEASKIVPEVEDLHMLSEYYKGIDLLMNDKSTAALAVFEKYEDKFPPDYKVEDLIVQAKVGASFDKGDYKGFLDASKQSLDLDSTAARSFATVASAYSCLYAEKGDISDKSDAEKYLAKARKIDDKTKESKEYYNLIEYRLNTRKLIEREDFVKQFPNGWTKN